MSNLFSVIVPIYNKEKYIKECIDSILNQSFLDYELILVDDGSTDNCPNICDEYANKDPRIKVIHKTNGGLVSARKEGTKLATGDYVVCVDADDYIKKDYLLNISKEINNNHSDIICMGHSELNNKTIKEIDIDYRKGYYSKDDIINEIYPSLIQRLDTKHFPVNIWSKAYKKDLYKDIQLNVGKDVKIGEDGVVSIPYIYKSNSMSIIKDYSYVYRLNDDSMTSNISVLQVDYPKLVTNEYLKYFDINTYDFKGQIDRFLIHQLFSMCVSQFNSNLGFKEVKSKLINILNDEYYKNALNTVEYTTLLAKIMSFVLNKQLIYIIYLVSKIK